MNIDTARSYKTEANLTKALDKAELSQFRPLIVCNRGGRFTAIFTVGQLRNMNAEYMATNIAHQGFMILG